LKARLVNREWQLVPTLLLAVIVIVLSAAAGLWWWAGTESSLQWALRRVAESQPLTAEGMSGTLRSGLNVRRLAWERDGLKIEAEDVELAWRPLFLFGGIVKLDRVHASALRITDRRPPSNEPFKLPDALVIRPEVELDDLRIMQVEWITNKAVRAEDLAGRYWFDGATHGLRLDNVRWAGGSYRATANLGARGPLPLDATISGKVEAPVPGRASSLPVEFTAKLNGPLADLQAQAQVTTTDTGAKATQATASARVTLWAEQPVPQAQADLNGLDLAALWPEAPQTQLAGQVRLAPAGADTWQVDADVRNAIPGPWDGQRLPVSQLKAQGQWRKGMALVQNLDAQLGGGRMKASGQWKPGNAGWTLRGDLVDVDPAALHTKLAAAPLGGRVEMRQDGGAVVFDLGLKGSGRAVKAPKRGARAKPAPARLEIRQVKANGRWAGGQLSVPVFAVVAGDATLHGSIDADIPSRSGSGRLSLLAPGLRATANGEVSEAAGRGNAQIDSADLASAQRWLQQLPGMDAAGKAPPLGGRAAMTLAWQGGWSDPTVQARLSSQSLELGSREPNGAAAAWAATDVLVTLNGRLSDATLAAQARARQGTRQVGLQLSGRGGRAPLKRGTPAQWRGNIASLDLSLLDPAIGSGAWQLALQRPVDLRWSPGGSALDVTGGQATLSSPAVQGAAPPSKALLAWDPVRWRAGELHTAGRLTGLPLGWLELLGGQQLAGSALAGDMVFDAQWDASLGRELKLNASIARSRGDVTVLAESAPGVASRVAAGVREARLTLASQGEQATITLRWDSERAGVADGRLVTRLSRGGPAGWEWPEQAPISGTLRAQMPRIGVWSVLAPPGWRLRGSLLADVKAAGTRADPQLSGTIAADDLALRSVVDGIELRDGRLRARLEGNRVLLTEFTLHGGGAQGSGGLLSATGEATWTGGSPRLQARAQLTRLRASIRSDRQLTVSGRLDARVEPTATQVRGNLKVDQARITLPEETEPRLGDDVVVRNAASLGTTAKERSAPPQQTAGGSAAPSKRPLDVAVDLDLGDDFQVQGRGLRTRLRGTLALSGQSLAAPQLNGTITTVRGEYRAYNQRLDVERGVLRFNGRIDNPALDILAVRPNISQRVGVLITGNAQAPFVRLYSEPELPDAEKLAWLVTGRPVPDTGAEAALVQQAALALLSSRRPGATSFASRVGLDELSVRRSGSEGAVVSLGKRFADNFYASYERSLSGALGTLYIFYDVSRRLTVRAEAGERAGVDLIFTFAFD
jgi:translocation and assembly module TamB